MPDINKKMRVIYQRPVLGQSNMRDTSFISGMCLGGPCHSNILEDKQEGQGLIDDVKAYIDTSGSGLQPAGYYGSGLEHAGYYGEGLQPAGEGLILPGEGLQPAGLGLEPAGRGHDSLLPADELKMKLIKELSRKSGKKKRKSGKGFAENLPAKFISRMLIPELLPMIGIHEKALTIQQIEKTILPVFQKHKGDDLKVLADHLAKAILPMLVKGKFKSLGLKMRGKGVIKDMLGNMKGYLQDKLASGIIYLVKKFARGSTSGRGLNLAGGNFFKDFAKGFTSIFKPIASIAGPIASALGVPELGVPLSIAGKFL